MTRVEQLKKLIELDPRDPMSHYGLGLEYVNLQEWDNAIAAFGQAIAADANYSSAYYHKARAEIGGGRHADAKTTLTKGMEIAQAAGDWHTQGEMRELLESVENSE